MMYNLFGALVFLVIGIIDVMFMQRMVYPQMRRRHEAAKVTGSQGQGPGAVHERDQVFQPCRAACGRLHAGRHF